MRDYALHRATSFEEGYGFSIVSRLWRNWQARKSMVSLAACDDYMLRDIGLTRDEVQWATRLPLTVNAAIALEERAFQRSHHGN